MFEQDFVNLLTEYPDAVHDKKRFVGLIKDYFPQNQKEMNLIRTLYEIDIVKEIDRVAVITNAFAYRLVKRLTEDFGTSRLNADWAVAMWCVCYGKKICHKQCDVELQSDGSQPAISEDDSHGQQKYRDLFRYTQVSGGYAVCGYTGSYTQTIIFQNRFNNKPVVSVYPSSFQESDAEELIMTEGYTVIGDRAFAGCNRLKQIVMAPTLKEIGASAFQGDGALSIINLPYGLEKIEKYAFADTGIRDFAIPSTVFWTGEGVLSGCKQLSSIKIPKNITELPNRMFRGCTGLRKIELPDTLQKIGDEVFKDCSELDLITVPDSVTEIGIDAFDNTHKKIIVQCSVGTYTEQYCRNNQIKYQLV